MKATNALHQHANVIAMPATSPSVMPETYMYGAATTPTSSVASSGGWSAPVAQQPVHPRNGFVDLNSQEVLRQNNYVSNTMHGQQRPESAKFERRPMSAKQDRRPWSASSDIPADRHLDKSLDPDGRKSAAKIRGQTLNMGKNGGGDYVDQCDLYNGYQTPRNEDSVYSGLEDNNEYTSRKIRDDIPDSDLIDYEDDGGDSLVESVDMEYDDSLVRIFIALFDYDPSIMSPNPDAIDEELPFKEGQLIKVSVEKGDVRFIYLPKNSN